MPAADPQHTPDQTTSTQLQHSSSPTASVPPVIDGVGYQVRHTHKAFTRILAEKLAPHGVTPGQWTVLRALWKEDGYSQVELANRIRLEKASLTSVLTSLERKGFIVRQRSLEDRRRWNVLLTAAGHELKPVLLPFATELDSLATRGFTPAECKQLHNLLTRVMHNLS